jgi:hypothetical protein
MGVITRTPLPVRVTNETRTIRKPSATVHAVMVFTPTRAKPSELQKTHGGISFVLSREVLMIRNPFLALVTTAVDRRTAQLQIGCSLSEIAPSARRENETPPTKTPRPQVLLASRLGMSALILIDPNQDAIRVRDTAKRKLVGICDRE